VPLRCRDHDSSPHRRTAESGRLALCVGHRRRKERRQINNYHHQLGEGTLDEFAPPLIESRSKNYLTMSLEEISEGKIVYEYTK
jgi:DNA-directed RNA polymerase subunit omega